MIDELKLQALKELGVYELRELARMVGVSSPTTKKRRELEEAIIEYSTDKELIEKYPPKKGRPPKSIKKIENVVDVFVPKELIQTAISRRSESELDKLLHCCQDFVDGDEEVHVQGYVRLANNKEYYVRDKFNFGVIAAIPSTILTTYNLQVGDKINGLAFRAKENNYFRLIAVDKVNDSKPVADRPLVTREELVLSHNYIEELQGVEEGSKVVFVGSDFNDTAQKIASLCNTVKDKYRIIVFAPGINSYQKLFLDECFGDVDIITTFSEEHPSYMAEVLSNVTNNANVLMREGNKVLLVVLDLCALKHFALQYLAYENEKNSVHEDIESSMLVMRVFNYAKTLKTGGSVTVLASIDSDQLTNEFVATYIKKNSDKFLYV